jgi:hypothetical protein
MLFRGRIVAPTSVAQASEPVPNQVSGPDGSVEKEARGGVGA